MGKYEDYGLTSIPAWDLQKYLVSAFSPLLLKYKLNTKPHFDAEWTFPLFNDLWV